MSLKVTSPNYQLPIVTAIRLEKQVSEAAGATEPILVETVDEDGNLAEYYVKLNGHHAVYGFTSVRELICAWMAFEMGIHVPRPAGVLIQPDFVQTVTNPITLQNILKNSIGLNYGSLNLGKGYHAFTPATNITFNLMCSIFYFDILINNPDRSLITPRKPNLLTNGEKHYLIDHEKGLSFAELFGLPSQPWLLSENDKIWIKNHLFYQTLSTHHKKGKPIPWPLLNDLSPDFWLAVNRHIPNEWLSAMITKVKLTEEFILAIVNNQSLFSSEIEKIL